MIAAPLSESFGRLVVYRVTTLASMLFALGAGFSNSFAALCVCRFFTGFFGSSCLAVGSGTLADLYPPRSRALAAIIFLTGPFLGPAFG